MTHADYRNRLPGNLYQTCISDLAAATEPRLRALVGLLRSLMDEQRTEPKATWHLRNRAKTITT